MARSRQTDRNTRTYRMKRLRRKFSQFFGRVIFFSTCIGAVALAVLFMRSDDSDRYDAHMKRADSYLASARYPEAIIEFRNALSFEYEDEAAHVGLAKSYFGNSEIAAGFWWISETVRLHPKNVEAGYLFGEISLLAGEPSKALGQANVLIAIGEDNLRSRMIRATALEKLQRFDDAQEAYERIVEAFPANPKGYILYSSFLAHRGEAAASLEKLKQATEMAPSFESWIALVNYLVDDPTKDETDILVGLKEAFRYANAAQLQRANRMIADYYFRNNEPDKALETLEGSVATDETDTDSLYMLAHYYSNRGDLERAGELFEEALRRAPEDAAPQLAISLFYQKRGELQAALGAAKSAVKLEPENPIAQLRLAELYIESGSTDGSDDVLPAGRVMVHALVKKEPTNVQARYLQARIDFIDGNYERAIENLRGLVEQDPNWSPAHLQLGLALHRSKHFAEARESLERTLKLNQNQAIALRALVDTLFHLGDIDLALDNGRYAFYRYPSDLGLRKQLIQLELIKGNIESARLLMEGVPEDQRSVDELVAMARIYVSENRLKSARKMLLLASLKDESALSVLDLLTALDLSEGKVKQAGDRIDHAIQGNKDNGQLHYLRGLVWVRMKESDQAQEALKVSIELAPEEFRAYSLLTNLYLKDNSSDQVMDILRELIQEKPEAVGFYVLLGQQYEAKKDYKRAIERYNTALDIDPSFGFAKNNLAYLLAETNRELDRAVRLAREAMMAYPSNPNVMDTMGWVSLKSGDAAVAVTYLEQAMSTFRPMDPALFLTRLHLAHALEANEEFTEANELASNLLGEWEDERKRKVIETGMEPKVPSWVEEVSEIRERTQRS